MAAPTKGSCRLRSSRALGAAFEAHQRHALSLGERFQPEVRFSRLTCRAADRPAPPSLTHSGHRSWLRNRLTSDGLLALSEVPSVKQVTEFRGAKRYAL